MANLVIATVMFPLIGIFFGVAGLHNDAKRRQGGYLLAIGIIEFAIVFALLQILRAMRLP